MQPQEVDPGDDISTQMIHWVTGASPRADSAPGEKPPIATAEVAYENALNGLIAGSSRVQPSTARASVPTALTPTYTFHRRRASSRTVAPSGSISLGPGSSRCSNCLPPTRSRRQHGDRQDDDAHAAEPVRELAPEQHVLPERVDVRQHGRAGRGETGHRLEVRVDRVAQLLDPAEQERERAERGHQHPDHRHDQEHLARSERQPGAIGGQPIQAQSDHPHSESGDQER